MIPARLNRYREADAHCRSTVHRIAPMLHAIAVRVEEADTATLDKHHGDRSQDRCASVCRNFDQVIRQIPAAPSTTTARPLLISFALARVALRRRSVIRPLLAKQPHQIWLRAVPI